MFLGFFTLLYYTQDFAEIMQYYDSFFSPRISLGHNKLKETPGPFSKK